MIILQRYLITPMKGSFLVSSNILGTSALLESTSGKQTKKKRDDVRQKLKNQTCD